jgi:UDP-N-acetylmuramoyl-L-alanyl-D-glutamate--2,6-diaminopimelate ligase
MMNEKILSAGGLLHHMTTDSREVQKGSVFVAYPGQFCDGRDFIPQAIENGAAAVLWEKAGFNWDDALQYPNEGVFNLKHQAGQIASQFYGRPSERLWVIGTTGTNGKTTCSHWIAQAFNALHKKTAVIGTIGNGVLNSDVGLSQANNTTPDSILLQKTLSEYLEQQVDVVAMEVSSHGLDQGRVNGVDFDIAVFTNLTRDHLDYHGDMEAYAEAKKKLFNWSSLRCAVVNVDDELGQLIVKERKAANKQVMTYALKNKADVFAQSINISNDGIQMNVVTPLGELNLKTSVIGDFNVYNLLAVVGALLASGIELNEAIEAVSKVKAVAGRMQQFGGKALPLVIVDYAHTPDALQKALEALKPQTKGKLICVFGCGGDRDQGKRPLMAKVATRIADELIITSDNPRNEPPDSIINDILMGAPVGAKVIQDRTEAIHFAIKNANKNDVILVAGKGHENYQEIAGVRYPFWDAEVVKNALQEVST